MRKILLFCALCVVGTSSYAQTSNVFPPNGNSGIGTNSPNYPLEVIGSIKTDSIVFPDGSVQTTALSDSLEVIKLGQNSLWLTKNGILRDDGDLKIQSTDTLQLKTGDTIIATQYNTIINAQMGKVGIGTLTPNEKLTVAGIVESTGGGFKFPDGSVQTTAATGGSTFQTIQVFERINLGNTMRVESAIISASGNYELWADDEDFWINSYQGTLYNFNTILNANSSIGKVGIGTVSPSAKLHILGSFRLQDGSEQTGYVLTSSADGTASWQATTSGGSNWTRPSNDIMYNTALNDKVGIGLIDPVKVLHIRTEHILVGQGGGPSSSHQGIRLQDDFKLSSQGSIVSSSIWDIEIDGESGKMHIGNLTDTVITIMDDIHNNVGIGTLHPHKKLHVSTTHSLSLEPTLPTCVTDPNVSCQSNSTNQGTHRGLRLEDRTSFSSGLQLNTVWDIVPEYGLLTIGVPGITPALTLVSDISSGTSGVTVDGSMHVGPDIHLFGASGKIESTTLHVEETIQVGTSSLLLGLLNNITENNIWTTSSDLILQNDNTGNPNGRVGIRTSSPVATLHVNGNALIGTQSPISGNHVDYKLAVDGKFVARQMHTTITGWGDFVFDENYERMSLETKEEFVLKNKHLPRMQTANVIESEGLDVGQTLKGVTINVEENTLDLIALNKLVQEQSEEIRKLKEILENQE